ncbi:MAG TPA: oligogalacturonate lyase family protein [Opitutaceae bacterium]|nr:oligogalacturonate lyase family protein [Opitutaceae bacterium]
MTRQIFSAVFLASLALATMNGATAAEPPTEWIDADTGHRVVRLSREAGSTSLYFHQNSFTPEGDKLIFAGPKGLMVLDLKTRETKVAVPGFVYRVRSATGVEVGHRTRHAYYEKDGAVWATHLDTLVTRQLAKLPPSTFLSAINADETLAAGLFYEGDRPAGTPGWPEPGAVIRGPDGRELTFAEQREVLINERLEKRLPMGLFTVDLRDGKVTKFHRTTDWLGHVQFSPTDPGLIMFCNEGNWHKVDRLWTIRTDGSGLTKLHTRTMNMEIAGHEFFAPDGRAMWYDLQLPRGEDFWLAGYEFATAKRTWYHLDRNFWSVHFTVSRDGTLFAGDGGDSEMVAHAPDGKWIYLFRPERIPDVAGIKNPNAGNLIDPGVLRAERLVNLAKHDYQLEPNIHFTPDQKWLVFRSNLHGEVHTYAVEIAKAQ